MQGDAKLHHPPQWDVQILPRIGLKETLSISAIVQEAIANNFLGIISELCQRL